MVLLLLLLLLQFQKMWVLGQKLTQPLLLLLLGLHLLEFLELLYLVPVLQFGQQLMLLFLHKSAAEFDVLLHLKLVSYTKLLKFKGSRVLGIHLKK